MAHHLADQYERGGLDPKLAYAQDDNDFDFRTEFGV